MDFFIFSSRNSLHIHNVRINSVSPLPSLSWPAAYFTGLLSARVTAAAGRRERKDSVWFNSCFGRKCVSLLLTASDFGNQVTFNAIICITNRPSIRYNVDCELGRTCKSVRLVSSSIRRDSYKKTSAAQQTAIRRTQFVLRVKREVNVDSFVT